MGNGSQAQRLYHHLSGMLEKLFADYADVLARYAALKRPVPRPAAYEFQHAMAHMTQAKRCGPDNSGRIRQYRSAKEHLERGLLDAWKLLIFDNEHDGIRHNACLHNVCLKNPKFLKQLIANRLREYHETIKSGSGEETTSEERNDAVLPYKKLFNDLYAACNGDSLSCPEPGVTQPITVSANESFFEKMHEWVQYELVLSALTGVKDVRVLTSMLNAVLSTQYDIFMENCLGELRMLVTNELLKLKKDNDSLHAWVDEHDTRKKRHAEAFHAIDAKHYTDHAIVEFLEKDLFPSYEIKFKPFT